MSPCPIDDRFFGDTVTLYRKTSGGITRTVAENAYFVQKRTTTSLGADSTFLLILPWDGVDLAPGDRVYAGIGPVSPVWSEFIPQLTPQVSIIGKVTVRTWQGSPCHVEATN